jgi:hypothetical protein
MPDAAAAVAASHRTLRSGGRLAEVDDPLAPGVVRRALDPVYARIANWQDVEGLELLWDAFRTVEVVSTHDAGLSFVAVAVVRKE